MKYIHGIIVVNRPDLLKLAVHGSRSLWPQAFILDNSPDGWIGKRHRGPIPVMRPSVPLSCAQSMNFLQRLAREKRADVFGYQHNDAEPSDAAVRQSMTVVRETVASGRKWATVFTHYDIISAYNVRAVADIGEWDVHFPQPNYHIDADWFHRARLKGYELIESGAQVTHHCGSSSTIRSDAHLSRLNGVKFPMNEIYYAHKWGGPTHGEKFATPWDEKPAG